jgi:hypothetical protein
MLALYKKVILAAKYREKRQNPKEKYESPVLFS